MNQSFIIRDAVQTSEVGKPLYFPKKGFDIWTDKITEAKLFVTNFVAVCKVQELIDAGSGSMFIIEPIYH